MGPGSLLLSLAASSGTAEQAAATNRAIVLFVTIAALLGLFLIVIVLLSISNRRHTGSDGESAPTSDADAWSIAGERAEPFDRPAPRDGEQE